MDFDPVWLSQTSSSFLQLSRFAAAFLHGSMISEINSSFYIAQEDTIHLEKKLMIYWSKSGYPRFFLSGYIRGFYES